MSKKRKVPLFAVGVFLLTGLSVLGWMILKYGGTNEIQEGYSINVEFDDASGIIEGGIVRIAGANVGVINSAPTLTDAHKIIVPITIREDLKLPTNTRFEITSLSLLGDKAIYLKVPKNPAQTFIKDGAFVQGISPKGLGEVQDRTEVLLKKTSSALEEYKEVAEKLNITLNRLNNSILEDDKLEDIGITVENLKEASQSFKELTNGLHPLADEARLTMAEFRKTAKGANNTMTGVSKTLEVTEDTVLEARATFQKVNNSIGKLDPTLNALPETLKTYDRVGKSLEKSFNSEDSLLSTVTQDKEVKNDAKTFVKNLRTNGILGYKDDSDPNKDDPRDRYRGMRR